MNFMGNDIVNIDKSIKFSYDIHQNLQSFDYNGQLDDYEDDSIIDLESIEDIETSNDEIIITANVKIHTNNNLMTYNAPENFSDYGLPTLQIKYEAYTTIKIVINHSHKEIYEKELYKLNYNSDFYIKSIKLNSYKILDCDNYDDGEDFVSKERLKEIATYTIKDYITNTYCYTNLYINIKIEEC